MPRKILASAATKENLEKLIQQHFYSPSCRIVGNKVHNSKGEIKGFEVVEKKGRFIFKDAEPEKMKKGGKVGKSKK